MTTDVRTPCQTNWRPFIAPEGERTSGPSAQARVAEAKRLCRGCFRRLECRDEGRAIGAEGIWGGEDDKQRRKAGVVIAPPLPELPDRCGTPAGAQRHRRAGETLCGMCLAAEKQAGRERRARYRGQRPPTMPGRGPQFLELLAQGMSPMEITKRLGLEKSTTYGTIARICTHLEAPLDQLVEVARARGIIPPAGTPAAADLDTRADLAVAA